MRSVQILSFLSVFLLLAAGKPVLAEEVAAPAESAPAAEPQTEAPDEPASSPHSRILPVKIKPVQEGADGVSKAAPDIEQQSDIDADTLALYINQGDGSFGPNLWKGLSREDVIKGIAALPVPQSSPTLRQITLRVLLSKAPVPPSKAEPPVADIFAARMTKLIEMGAFREAMSLYEKLDAPASSAQAALAGMKAFIGNGQVAIACLEERALDPTLKSDDAFWKDLGAFCKFFIKVDADSTQDDSQSLMRAATAYAKERGTVSPANFEELNNKSLIELLVLSKAGILDRGKWSVTTAEKLNPATVAFLLSLQPTNVEQKLALFTVAVMDGIRAPEDLDAAYKEIAVSPSQHGAWAPLLNTYTKFNNAETDAEKLKQLKALLSTVENTTPAALTPLATALTTLKPAAPLTPDDARHVLRALIFAGAQIPAAWVNFAYGTTFAEEDSGESSLLKVWNQPQIEPVQEGQKAPSPAKAVKPKLTPELAYALILQPYLADPAQDAPAEKSAYDNFLSLTGVNNYVMPSDELTESLKKAAQAGSLGKILLSSLQSLNGLPMDRVHPQLLSQVLKIYKTAGLSEETVSLAHEALEGLTNKKEN